jgi:hypothetical protein
VANCTSRIGDLEWERETIISGLKASAGLENRKFRFVFQAALINLESRRIILKAYVPVKPFTSLQQCLMFNYLFT